MSSFLYEPWIYFHKAFGLIEKGESLQCLSGLYLGFWMRGMWYLLQFSPITRPNFLLSKKTNDFGYICKCTTIFYCLDLWKCDVSFWFNYGIWPQPAVRIIFCKCWKVKVDPDHLSLTDQSQHLYHSLLDRNVRWPVYFCQSDSKEAGRSVDDRHGTVCKCYTTTTTITTILLLLLLYTFYQSDSDDAWIDRGVGRSVDGTHD